MSDRANCVPAHIFLCNNLLPNAILCFKFPPPLAEQADIHSVNVFNAQTTILFVFVDNLPSQKVIFPFLSTPLPKESSSLLVKLFMGKLRKEIHGDMIDKSIGKARIYKCGSASNGKRFSLLNGLFVFHFFPPVEASPLCVILWGSHILPCT